MNTILILTLAGTCMTIFYLVCLKTVGGTFWGRKLWLTMAALFYLVPLGDLKVLYVEVIHKVGNDKYLQGMYYSDLRDFVEIRTGELIYKNEILRLDTIIYAVWMTVAVGIFLYNLIRHLVHRHWIAYDYEPLGTKEMEALERLKGSMKIRRRIRLVFWENATPMTMGFFCPVIILPEKMRENLPEPVLKHELIHIKNGDMLVKIILNMITTIHWFNPFAYILMREYEKVFELICDEKAVDGCSPRVKIDYMNRLLEESRPVPVSKGTWFHHLSKEGKFLEERIENIMDKKRYGKIRTCVGSIALVAALFISSLTALAYEDVYGLETDNSIGTQWIDVEGTETFANAEVWFDLDSSTNANTISVANEDIIILYDEQFIDEEGNVFEVNFDATPYLNCNHNFESGTLTRHTTFTDGSCTVEYYRGQMCTKCAYTIVGDFINKVTYQICPH